MQAGNDAASSKLLPSHHPSIHCQCHQLWAERKANFEEMKDLVRANSLIQD
jgi:hypothetical protein